MSRVYEYGRGIKRSLLWSSGESSTDGSSSPEIACDSAPSIYELRKSNDQDLIVKLTMKRQENRRRSQKCTKQDIEKLLDSDTEESMIFDARGKTSQKLEIQLKNNDRHKEKLSSASNSPSTARNKKILPDTPKGATDREENYPRGTPSSSKRSNNMELSLKMKLRRSTECSNYKVTLGYTEEEKNNAGTPKKRGVTNDDTDNSENELTRRSLKGTPTKMNTLKESSATTATHTNRGANSKSDNYDSDLTEPRNIHNKENQLKVDKNIDNDEDASLGRSRRANLRSATPQLGGKNVSGITESVEKTGKLNGTVAPKEAKKYILDVSDDEEVETRKRLTRDKVATPQKRLRGKSETPSTTTRPRRQSRTVRYNVDDSDYSLSDLEEEKVERVEETRVRSTRRSAATQLGSTTPKKQPKIPEEAMTPKRTLRSIVAKEPEESPTPRRTRRSSVSSQPIEPLTLRRTPRSVVSRIPEEPSTPKRTRGSSVSRIPEEPATPKRTPRQATIPESEEVTTPKRISRKPLRLRDDEEPTTPSKSRGNRKAVTPSIKHGNLTPSMSQRTVHVGTPKTILEKARVKLHVSAVPKSLPCREKEFNEIFEFLQSKLAEQSSGCMFIGGTPGTGKTATVTEVVRALKKCVDNEVLIDFKFIAINGMKISAPRQVYAAIVKQLTGDSMTWEEAYAYLDKRFKKSAAKRVMTVLLVDELDMLRTKRQDVLYNLMDWPTNRNAFLAVIAIANTLDLPEILLKNRVTSRLGCTRVKFDPYTYKQLQEIVGTRLKNVDAFTNDAVELVSRKIAAVSGDARRALDICRRATEITEMKGEKTVTMLHVNEAVRELTSGDMVKAIMSCSEMEKFFLRAINAEISRTGAEEVKFLSVYNQLYALCALEGIGTAPKMTEARSICSRLSSYRLILWEPTNNNDLDQRILLNVSSDDIHFATQA